MSEQLLQQILTELKSTNQRLDKLETEIKEIKVDQQIMRSEISDMKSDITEIKKDTALIPQIQRAVLDVGDDVTEHDRILGNLKKAF